MLRRLFYGKPNADFIRRNFITIFFLLSWILYFIVFFIYGVEHYLFTNYLLPICGISLFILPFSIYFSLKWGGKAKLVQKTFGDDITSQIDFKQLYKLALLAESDAENIGSIDQKILLKDLDTLLTTYGNTAYFNLKPIGFFEVIINLTTSLMLYPFLFLFQSRKSRNVKVGVIPSEINVAKVATVLTVGLYWQYLRYFSTQCPVCNCRNSLILVNSEYVSSHLETYTENIETRYNDTKGQLIGTSTTPVQKLKTVTVNDNTYECGSCRGKTEVRENQ